MYFLQRGEGTEKEKKRDINWSPLAHPQLRTWPATQACDLTGGNQTSDLSVLRPALNPLSHSSQGRTTGFVHPPGNKCQLPKVFFKKKYDMKCTARKGIINTKSIVTNHRTEFLLCSVFLDYVGGGQNYYLAFGQKAPKQDCDSAKVRKKHYSALDIITDKTVLSSLWRT